MNRRNLLTAAAASVMLPGAVKAEGAGQPVHPDAELIAACAEYRRIQWAFEAYYDTLPDGDIDDDDPAWAMLGPVNALVEQIVALRATTAEGHLARGRALAFHYQPHHASLQDDPDRAFSDRAQAAALRDLVSIERGAAMPIAAPPIVVEQPKPFHPDADLLEACAAFDALERAYIAAGGDYAFGSLEHDIAEAERARLSDAQDPLVERMCELRAVTREGQAARARSLALWDAELMKPGPGDTGTWLTAAIVRDLIDETKA